MRENTYKFLVELSILLRKYNMHIVAEDAWRGYAECGADIQIYFENQDPYIPKLKFKWGAEIGHENITNSLIYARENEVE